MPACSTELASETFATRLAAKFTPQLLPVKYRGVLANPTSESFHLLEGHGI